MWIVVGGSNWPSRLPRRLLGVSWGFLPRQEVTKTRRTITPIHLSSHSGREMWQKLSELDGTGRWSGGLVGRGAERCKGAVREPLNQLFLVLWDTMYSSYRNQRGSGVLPNGQHSWNISVTKEARVDPKVVLESLMKCPSRGIFFCSYIFLLKQTNILQHDTSSSLIGY